MEDGNPNDDNGIVFNRCAPDHYGKRAPARINNQFYRTLRHY